MSKKWVYPENKEILPELAEISGSRIIAGILLNRGIDSVEKAKAFLDIENIEISSPYVFQDMEKAVNRINQAIKKQEHVVIFGDFDADGVTSTSLLYKALKHLKTNVSYYIPNRSTEGHGLNSAAICKLISSKQAKLIITVDCGINNLSEIALAKSLGTDIIITDHHEPPETLPLAFAIINPKAYEGIDNLKCLSGVGVAYKLACALLESNNEFDFSAEIIYLAALGTIGDVVPLTGENRALVYRGLKSIPEKRPMGLIKLIEASGYDSNKDITTDIVAFGIVPRINAIGRLEDAGLAVELLISQDADESEDMVKKLNNNNKIRQQIGETIFIEADSQVSNDPDFNKAIILADENWHPGVIGIVASKLVEKYYKPAFLAFIDKENNEIRCSARGVAGLNLYNTLEGYAEFFKKFGGHALAAGFTLDLNKISFEDFKNKLNAAINENTDFSNIESELNVDIAISSNDLTENLIKELNNLAPFGEGNPTPVFSISNLTLKQYKTMGSAKNHLKIFLADDNNNVFEAVWWQKNFLDAEISDRVNVAFSPEINIFNGKSRIQLLIKDIQSLKFKEQKKSDLKKITVSDSSFAVKWIDHRQKKNIYEIFSNYLKTSKTNIAIFAENPDTLQAMESKPELQSRLTNRLNIKKSDQLLLFDLPPDLAVLSKLLEISSAKVIHLASKNYNGTNSKQLIQTISGMLKYAHNNKNGKINISEIASKLSTTNITVSSCLNFLNRASVISIIEDSSEIIEFEFLGSADLQSVSNLSEYNNFLDSIKIAENFRHALATEEIEIIKQKLSG